MLYPLCFWLYSVNSKRVNLVLPGLFKSFQAGEFDVSQASHLKLIQQFFTQATYRCTKDKNTRSFPVDYATTYSLAAYEDAGSEEPATVLYAEPVNIELKSDHIVAYPLAISEPDIETIENIITQFNQHFSADGLSLKYLPSGRIICHSSSPVVAEMTSAYAVYGRDMKHFLPRGEQSAFWLRVTNEVQMFLHEYIEHQDKLFAGRLLNGFWFFGGGSAVSSDFERDALISDASWAEGFCQQHNIERLQLADIAASARHNFQLVDESLLLASSCGDMDLWLTQLAKVETEILRPLIELLKSGKITEVNIHDTDETFYQFKNIYKYRFFRKKKSLQDICVVEA